MIKNYRILCCVAVLSIALTTSAGGQEQETEHRISMTMKDAELADVMDMLSREHRTNIFVSTDSPDTVSFSLYDMPLHDAIRAIANAAGLAVEHYDGNFYIVDRDEAGKYAPDALTRVRSFELQYIDAANIQSLLDPYLSEYGEITVLQERNMFLVEDTPEFLNRIAGLVATIDRPPTQILIEAKILEVTLTDEDSYGLDWTRFFDSDGGTGEFGTQSLGDPQSPGFFLDYASPDFAATLNALTSQGRVRTLSTPKLLATENIESSVIIGDRRGYPVTTTINQVTTESIEFLESGVILRVTPSVDADGRVMLDINPEVSTGVIDPISGIPSQTTTEVTTRMIVGDGQTIFVGGLIKHRVDESKRGVPVVGRIPLLGRLFSNRQETLTNTETVVLITPTIVSSPTETIERRPLDTIDRLERDQKQRSEALDEEMELFFGTRPDNAQIR
ncbi:MAG: secretin N-terminal domain-containing protein [Woeseiaceae bacterium]|nr:secretin N-terminal domain-containing protein [Woeseiaceae bacterium]